MIGGEHRIFERPQCGDGFSCKEKLQSHLEEVTKAARPAQRTTDLTCACQSTLGLDLASSTRTVGLVRSLLAPDRPRMRAARSSRPRLAGESRASCAFAASARSDQPLPPSPAAIARRQRSARAWVWPPGIMTRRVLRGLARACYLRAGWSTAQANAAVQQSVPVLCFTFLACECGGRPGGAGVNLISGPQIRAFDCSMLAR